MFRSLPALFALLLIAVAPTVNLLTRQSWHDQQRLLQIIIIVLAICSLVATSWHRIAPNKHSLATTPQVLLVGILILGIASSLMSHQPLWAFTELSLFIGCFSLTIACRDLREHFGPRFDSCLLFTLTFVVAAITVKFLASYAAALVFHQRLEPDAMLGGFANLRHLGQFQTLSMPLLALPLLLPNNSKRLKFGAMLMLSLWWLTIITGGTRACLLAVGCIILIMIPLGAVAKRWITLQAIAIAIAALAFWIFMRSLPAFLKILPSLAETGLFRTSLSGREALWSYCLQLIHEYPWIGAGPMHFADQTRFSYAHPHQSILQWASEWGLPSLCLVVALLVISGLAVLRTVYSARSKTDAESILRLCLLGSLTGLAAQSMVDGVTVMPYTQIWLAIIAGWLWGLQPASIAASSPTKHSRILALLILLPALLAAGCLSHVALRDYKMLETMNLPDTPARPGKGADPPRFWLWGSIANPESKASADSQR